MLADDVKLLKELGAENRKVETIVADLTLDKAMAKAKAKAKAKA